MLYHGNAATAIHTMLIRCYVMAKFLFIDRIAGISWAFNFSSNNDQNLTMKLRRWTRKPVRGFESYWEQEFCIL